MSWGSDRCQASGVDERLFRGQRAHVEKLGEWGEGSASCRRGDLSWEPVENGLAGLEWVLTEVPGEIREGSWLARRHVSSVPHGWVGVACGKSRWQVLVGKLGRGDGGRPAGPGMNADVGNPSCYPETEIPGRILPHALDSTQEPVLLSQVLFSVSVLGLWVASLFQEHPAAWTPRI